MHIPGAKSGLGDYCDLERPGLAFSVLLGKAYGLTPSLSIGLPTNLGYRVEMDDVGTPL